MIEVVNIEAVNKGYMLARCDVRIVPWKITFHDIKIFEKGNSRWITMPAKEVMGDNNEKKYVEVISWDNDAVKNRFRRQIMDAIDAYLKINPEMKSADVIKDEELPF